MIEGFQVFGLTENHVYINGGGILVGFQYFNGSKVTGYYIFRQFHVAKATFTQLFQHLVLSKISIGIELFTWNKMKDTFTDIETITIFKV